MQSTYQLHVDDLDERFLQGLRHTYAGKTIEIIVCEVDETDYLLSSAANRERLLKAIENVEKGENLIEVDIEVDIDELSGGRLSKVR